MTTGLREPTVHELAPTHTATEYLFQDLVTLTMWGRISLPWNFHSQVGYMFHTVRDPCRLATWSRPNCNRRRFATWTPICDPISYKPQHRNPPISKPESHATARKPIPRGVADALKMVSTASNQMSTLKPLSEQLRFSPPTRIMARCRLR